ncbi:MAG TPA: hypothetical protein VHE57_14815, partial [Mycobacteriales bacterium]|nr:hypothetical protein [Mycobacteriales bacterium]
VPAGDLAVAGPQAPAAATLPAGPVAESYLMFDVSDLPVGSTISSFVISLPVDAKGVTVDPLGAGMVACAVKTGWSGGQQASPYSGKPTDGCDVHSPKLKAVDDGERYTVDIAEIAQRWVRPDALNLGVAITDNPANATTIYQVVFGPRSALSKLTASVTYVPPEAAERSAPAGPSPGAPASGSPPGHGAAPVITFEPLPPGMPAVVAQPPAAAPARPVVAMTVRSADPSSPPLGFWIALVLVVALLGATTYVLADSHVTLTIRPQRGVAKALRSRLILVHR